MRFADRLPRWTLFGTLLMSLSLILAGCANSPVEPVTGGSVGGSGSGGGNLNGAPTGPDILVVRPDGSVEWTQPPVEGNVYPTSGPGSTGRKISVSKTVEGERGAWMQCGRFYLSIPAGAFEGTGEITVTMEDSTVMICDAEISPKELNEFLRPVKLALCVDGADVSADTVAIYWYDPEKRDWIDMGCDRDLSDDPDVTGPYGNVRGIVTILHHFSRYSGGKAGW